MTVHDVPVLRSCYQAVVSLRDSDGPENSVIAGYEALTRERRDGRWHAVDFDAAGSAAEQLDLHCRLTALDGALNARLGAELTLMVNVEPVTRDLQPRSEREWELVSMAQQQLRVVIEVTERALLEHPANVLRQVAFARACGWGVAVDDVGANPDSLAMLPFIAPDIVKLDLRLIQNAPDREQARTITAVMAHVERTQSIVLAEGIETPRHLEQARSFGATFFQGWLFGRPAPLPPAQRITDQVPA